MGIATLTAGFYLLVVKSGCQSEEEFLPTKTISEAH